MSDLTSPCLDLCAHLKADSQTTHGEVRATSARKQQPTNGEVQHANAAVRVGQPAGRDLVPNSGQKRPNFKLRTAETETSSRSDSILQDPTV